MKFAGFIFGVLLTVIGFYLGGYDFNERGFIALNLYINTIIFGIIGAIVASTLED